MDPNGSPPQLKMATITVGTSQGPSTIYARSRSSIHQHAMKVSLRRAGMRSSSDVARPAQASSAPQPRQELMGRFRAKENLGQRHEKHSILVNSKKATRPTEKPDEDSPISVRSTFPLNQQNPFHHFAFETSSDTVYLHSLLENSLFGQAPYVINADRPTFECALQDYALYHGVLALACLGRDINQEMKASHLCLKLKGLTIKAVRQRLSADSINIAIGTIGAIAALAAFDLLECLGRNEPRPDSMSFLHLAVSRKGGLSQLATEGRGPCGHAELLKRIIRWLDLSFAIMDETPAQFAFYDAPLHLPGIALHTVSLHMTPLQVVFAELSQLSRSTHETGADVEAEAPESSRKALADQVSGIEQYATNLRTAKVSPEVLEIIRLTTFLYSARYIRQLSSNSRIQMQLAVRLERRLAIEFQNIYDTEKVDLLSWQGKADQCPSYQAVITWAATVAAISSGSFKEVCGRDHRDRRAFWKDHIISMLEHFEIGSIGAVETTLAKLTHDTEACRKDRRLLLQACGVKES